MDNPQRIHNWLKYLRILQWPSIHRLPEAIHLSIDFSLGRRSRRAPVLQWLRWLQHFGASLCVHEKKVISRGQRWEKVRNRWEKVGKIWWFHQLTLEHLMISPAFFFCNEGDNFWDCSWKIDYRNCSPKYMLEEWEWQLIALKFVKSEHDQHVSTLGKCFEMFEVLEPNLRLFPTWMAMLVGEKQIGDRVTNDLVVKNGKTTKCYDHQVFCRCRYFVLWEGWTYSEL